MGEIVDSKKRKIENALIGFAIGDALGATTEFMTEKQVKEKYGVVDDIIGGGWLNLNPGDITDDTELMFEVADAYVEAFSNPNTYFLPCFTSSVAKRFVGWLKSNPKDVGINTRNVIEAVIRRKGNDNKNHVMEYLNWCSVSSELQSKSGYEANGNGALARCLFPAMLDLDPTPAIAQGRMTHNSLQSEKCIEIYHEMIHFTNTNKLLQYQASSGSAHDALAFTQKVFYEGKSFEDCMIEIVNKGGDADSIAAIAGGLLGWHEYDIPQRWIDKLNPQVLTRIDSIISNMYM